MTSEELSSQFREYAATLTPAEAMGVLSSVVLNMTVRSTDPALNDASVRFHAVIGLAALNAILGALADTPAVTFDCGAIDGFMRFMNTAVQSVYGAGS